MQGWGGAPQVHRGPQNHKWRFSKNDLSSRSCKDPEPNKATNTWDNVTVTEDLFLLEILWVLLVEGEPSRRVQLSTQLPPKGQCAPPGRGEQSPQAAPTSQGRHLGQRGEAHGPAPSIPSTSA